MGQFIFEKLEVYKVAQAMALDIYVMTDRFPSSELFGLTNQVRRASVSISLNIAEGSSRSKKDFAHFLSVARGSCYECVAIAELAKKRGLLSQSEYEKLYNHSVQISKMLTSLRKSILTNQ